MKLGRCLGEGAQAAVYEWEDGKVVKLFNPGEHRRGEAEYEARVTAAVSAAGVKCPAVYGTVEYDNRYGYIMDKAEGIPLIDLYKNGTPIEDVGKRLAELHFRIRDYKPEGVPKHKEWLRERLERLEAKGIPVEFVQSALKLLETLPDGDSLCHGDFHPLNVLVDGDGYTVIDWVGACIGSPLGDIAQTVVLMELAEAPESAYSPLTKEQFDYLRWAIQDSYLTRYAAIMGITRADLDRQLYDWVTVLALDRLHSTSQVTGYILDYLKKRRPFSEY